MAGKRLSGAIRSDPLRLERALRPLSFEEAPLWKTQSPLFDEQSLICRLFVIWISGPFWGMLSKIVAVHTPMRRCC